MTVEIPSHVYNTLIGGGMVEKSKCSICNVAIGYVYRDETVMFDSSCGCSERSDMRYADHDDMIWLSQQIADATRM